MDRDELAHFRDEYRKLDRSDPIAFRHWLILYPELTDTDLCVIIRSNINTIRKMKRKAGLIPALIIETNQGTLRKSQDTPPSPVAPDDWNDRWLADKYNAGVGIRALARAIDRSRNVIRTRLRRLKITVRRDNRHPCNNSDWLNSHYIEQQLSLRECALIANVSPNTIKAWLIKLDVDIRDHIESGHARLLGQKAPVLPKVATGGTETVISL